MATILIIDDNDEFRRMLRIMLEKENYEVIEASGGVKGCNLYREGNTNLLITDILMPYQDGIETICELRAEFKNIKIIAISGGGIYDKADYFLSSARLLGAQKILAKPFSRPELITAVKEVLGEC